MILFFVSFLWIRHRENMLEYGLSLILSMYRRKRARKTRILAILAYFTHYELCYFSFSLDTHHFLKYTKKTKTKKERFHNSFSAKLNLPNRYLAPSLSFFSIKIFKDLFLKIFKISSSLTFIDPNCWFIL